MPRLGPLKRRELIRLLRKAGFDGPYVGAKHQFMKRGTRTVRIPNPHQGDLSKGLLARVLREAGVSMEEWTELS